MKRIAEKGSSEAFLRAHVTYNEEKCLLWPYRLTKAGYGLAVIDGKQKPASRWMAILAHGEASSERPHAAHKCGNPRCVNPRHIYWATPAENAHDRLKHGTDNRGERNGKTHLTEQDILAIRRASPDLTSLSAKYGVSKGSISKIRSGQRWAHVKEPALRGYDGVAA